MIIKSEYLKEFRYDPGKVTLIKVVKGYRHNPEWVKDFIFWGKRRRNKWSLWMRPYVLMYFQGGHEQTISCKSNANASELAENLKKEINDALS